MVKNLVAIILFAFFVVFTFPAISSAAEILGPKVKIQNNNIIVSTGLVHLGEIETTIESGIEKKIVFTIELFRVWDFWPDEFVVSRRIKRSVRYDNLRDFYSVSSNDGVSKVHKKFKDFYTMKTWVFKVSDVNIANIRELESGNYYLRVVIESKSKKLPPVIGILMLFIPEVETIIAKESKPFAVKKSK